MSKTMDSDTGAGTPANGPLFGKPIPVPRIEQVKAVGANVDGLGELAAREEQPVVELPARPTRDDFAKLKSGTDPHEPPVRHTPRRQPEPKTMPQGTSTSWRKDGKRY